MSVLLLTEPLDSCYNGNIGLSFTVGKDRNQWFRGTILYLRSLETWRLVHWCERLLNGSGSVQRYLRRRCFEDCLYYRCNIAAEAVWWHGCELSYYIMVLNRRSLDIMLRKKKQNKPSPAAVRVAVVVGSLEDCLMVLSGWKTEGRGREWLLHLGNRSSVRRCCALILRKIEWNAE